MEGLMLKNWIFSNTPPTFTYRSKGVGGGGSLSTEKTTFSRHGNVPNETFSNFYFYKRYQPGSIISWLLTTLYIYTEGVWVVLYEEWMELEQCINIITETFNYLPRKTIFN